MKSNSARSKDYYRLIRIKPDDYSYTVGRHRYVLKFESVVPRNCMSVAIIQMNGSSTDWKDANKLDWSPDPTIGKVLCWCNDNEQEIFDKIYCLNLWSYADPQPRGLRGKGNAELNHAVNDKWITKICKNVDYVIIAHGDCNGVDSHVFKQRKEQLNKLLRGCDLYHVGELTKKGNNPRHGRGWNGDPSLNPL
ncbi:DUF1643 domain-containing protein [Paenibacillus sp. Cedars]|uniref:DUF1643 domain-containing protein n=1 Tax=Paenibacillus sp. Cedars TaxID=1980674 RepID=UPI001562BBD8|nr:DUF1643 domain-containing protein [Paenibacillus sp. Cedars]